MMGLSILRFNRGSPEPDPELVTPQPRRPGVARYSVVKEPLAATMPRPEIARPGASWRGGDAESGGQKPRREKAVDPPAGGPLTIFAPASR